ncbi:MAG: hypothetical protein K0R75_1734 [Paenibacillaceae bacterium]|jgi:hypothetical protein|nr:hypothetical protein [Paenibacillaceae bacterium]
MIMNSDWDALALALKTCYRISPQMAKIVRIKNTLELEEIEVAQPCLNGLAANAKVEVLSEPYPWEFDEQGNYKRLRRMP